MPEAHESLPAGESARVIAERLAAAKNGSGRGVAASGSEPKPKAAAPEPEPEPEPEKGTSWAQQMLVADADGVLDLERCLLTCPHTEQGAAESIVAVRGGEFCVEEGKALLFRRWDGRVWTGEGARQRVWELVKREFYDELEIAITMIKRDVGVLADARADEVLSGTGDSTAAEAAGKAVWKVWTAKLKDHEALFKKIGSTAGKKAVVEDLLHVRERAVRVEEFDSDLGVLVVENGVLNLGLLVASLREDRGRDGLIELMEHSPARMVTLSARVEYAPGLGVGPEWARYLRGALPSEEVRWFLCKALGSALLGDPVTKQFLNPVGPKSTGKSLLFNVVASVFGGYAKHALSDSFLERTGGRNPSAHSSDLDRLYKARLVVTGEPDKGKRFDAGLIKGLTGGDPQVTRGMWVGEQEWVPRFLFVMTSNHNIRMDTSDAALAGRLAVVPFERKFSTPEVGQSWDDIPEDERADEGLKRRILDSEGERSGVLNWLLEGLKGYLREGLVRPAEVLEATRKALMGGSDSLLWLAEWQESGRIVRSPVGAQQWQALGQMEAYEYFTKWWREDYEERDEKRGMPGVTKFRDDIASVGASVPAASLKQVGAGGEVRGRNRGTRVFDLLFRSDWESRWPK